MNGPPFVRAVPEEDAPLRTLARWFYLSLILVGILFYIGWGLFFGTWNLFEPENVGVYAVAVVLIGFGIVGTLLYSRKPD